MAIPKIIHQTVADRALINSSLLQQIEGMRRVNPDWQHIIYDDLDVEHFIANGYGSRFLSYYRRINANYGPAKADFFRYLLLYNCGGIYLDIKSFIDGKLDEVIRPSDTYILSHWRNAPGEPFEGWGLHPECGPYGEYQQWHIIAAPQHAFLRATISAVMWNIDNYSIEHHGVGKPGVLRTTGPIAYTKAITPLVDRYEHRLVDIESLGFVYSPGKSHEKSRSHYRRRKLSEPVVLDLVGDPALGHCPSPRRRAARLWGLAKALRPARR